MDKISKLVSLITPCYNAASYIQKLLDSVLIQRYPNIEMFVIDDGSKDNSAEIIKSYISKFKRRGYKLTYIYQENQGQSVAINNALKMVKGDYLAWPDADDYYASASAIEKMVKTLDESDDTVSMVRVEYNILNETGEIIGHQGVSSETHYKTNLFEDALFGENGFWYPPGGYMAKVAKIDERISNREIYTEKNAGQNFQIYFPLLYKQKCLTIEESLYNVLAHDDSHSRNANTNNERQKSYYRTIKNTLDKIEMPKEYRKYLLIRVQSMMDKAKIGKETQKVRYRAFVKRLVKSIIPYGVIVLLRKHGVLASPAPNILVQVPEKSQLERVTDYYNAIFDKGYAHNNLSKANIEGWMLFCSHVLEKAMSREKFEAGHNIFRLEQLRNLLDDYENKKFDKESFAYQYTLSSIKEYVLLHEKNRFSTNKIKDILGDWYEEALGNKKTLSGYKVISENQKSENDKLNFFALQNNRYSVREFSNKKVHINDIRQAIELSMKSPSICNRQGVRVYTIMDVDKIKRILEVQGGFGGYELPSCLLLVAHDTRSLVGINERNQGFIDGGLFSMGLLLSIEHYGLAACSLNAMFMPDGDQKVKEILDIENPEYLIMFIAVGHFKENTKVAVSSRYTGGEITKEIL